MNTLHLKYAVEIEKTGSITQAAENLYMAQPNLSKSIKELEDALGITIFERTSKGVLPTSNGKEFLKYARNILQQLEQIESLGTAGRMNSQGFSISAPRSSYISKAISDFICHLDQSNPMNIDIKETNSISTIHSVAEGQCNLGIIRYQAYYEKYFLDCIEEKNLCRDMIWEFEALCLMSKLHPLAGNADLRYAEMCSYTEIIEGDIVIPYLSTGGSASKGKDEKTPAKSIIVYDRGTKYDIMGEAHTAYSMGAPVPADVEDRYGLVQRKCDRANNNYKDLLVYRRGYEISDLDKDFLKRLYTIKNEIAYRNYD